MPDQHSESGPRAARPRGSSLLGKGLTCLFLGAESHLRPSTGGYRAAQYSALPSIQPGEQSGYRRILGW